MIALLLTAVAHEIGLARLRSHSSLERTHQRRRRSYVFYSGLAVLLVSILSPIDYWASAYFYVHMIEHVLMLFFAPALVVWGAPWVPLLFALPVTPRRKIGRYFYLSPNARLFRIVGRFIRNPWVAVIFFNATMLFWHIPRFFDAAERNQLIHIWLMHSSFIIAGVLFWLQIIPSFPMKQRKGAAWQCGAILSTNVLMTVTAISMSILATGSWYSVYNHVSRVSMSPFADQQIGAAILWVCGDFWALPTLIYIITRSMSSDKSPAPIISRLIGRDSKHDHEDFRWSSYAPSGSANDASASENAVE